MRHMLALVHLSPQTNILKDLCTWTWTRTHAVTGSHTHIHMCTTIHKLTHAYTCTRPHIHTWTYPGPYTCNTYICVDFQIHTFAHIHIVTYIDMHTLTHTGVLQTTHTGTDWHPCAHTYSVLCEHMHFMHFSSGNMDLAGMLEYLEMDSFKESSRMH